MKLSHKVAIAGTVGVAVAVAVNYCWNWLKKGDKGQEKKDGTPKDNDREDISMITATGEKMVEEIPLLSESGSSLIEVKAISMMKPDTEESVKEQLVPRSISNYKVEEQQGIYHFEVDEIGPVNALIDTGATECVVGRDVLTDSIKSKIEPLTGFAFTLPDGSKIDILGYVFLCVSYLNNKVKLPFFVVAESCGLPMTLGTTWIRKSRAILQSDGRNIRVTFGGKKEKTGCSKVYCSSPYALVNVDGVGKVSSLVDTGTKVCFIRRDMLTELQKENAIPTSVTATMANNAELKGVLETISLNITFGGIITCIEKVYIVSKIDQQLILGMDWIDKTRALIQSDGSEIIVSPYSRPKKEKKSS